MSYGEEIALKAMKKELKRLTRLAGIAGKEVEESITVGTEILAIHKELAAILDNDDKSVDHTSSLRALQKRMDAANKISKKDLMKLMKREDSAKTKVNLLHGEIDSMEYRRAARS